MCGPRSRLYHVCRVVDAQVRHLGAVPQRNCGDAFAVIMATDESGEMARNAIGTRIVDEDRSGVLLVVSIEITQRDDVIKANDPPRRVVDLGPFRGCGAGLLANGIGGLSVLAMDELHCRVIHAVRAVEERVLRQDDVSTAQYGGDPYCKGARTIGARA